MGAHKNITHKYWPKQSSDVGKSVVVCFHYNTNFTFNGRIYRDDVEEPFETIIILDDDRPVRATECQYSFK